MPFERDIYVDMLIQYIRDEEERQRNAQNR